MARLGKHKVCPGVVLNQAQASSSTRALKS